MKSRPALSKPSRLRSPMGTKPTLRWALKQAREDGNLVIACIRKITFQLKQHKSMRRHLNSQRGAGLFTTIEDPKSKTTQARHLLLTHVLNQAHCKCRTSKRTNAMDTVRPLPLLFLSATAAVPGSSSPSSINLARRLCRRRRQPSTNSRDVIDQRSRGQIQIKSVTSD